MSKLISIQEASKMLDKLIKKEAKILRDRLIKKNVWSEVKLS